MLSTTSSLQLPPLYLEAQRAQPQRAPSQRRSQQFTQRSPEDLAELVLGLGPRCQYDARTVANALGITLRHLERLFAKALARPPQAWLNEQRLLRGKDMLAAASCVKEVAFALGFGQPAQFSRDFKRKFGVAPSHLLPGRDTRGQHPTRIASSAH